MFAFARVVVGDRNYLVVGRHGGVVDEVTTTRGIILVPHVQRRSRRQARPLLSGRVGHAILEQEEPVAVAMDLVLVRVVVEEAGDGVTHIGVGEEPRGWCSILQVVEDAPQRVR